MLELKDRLNETRVYRLRWWVQGAYIFGAVVFAASGTSALFASTSGTLDAVKQMPINTILGVGLITFAAYIVALAVFSAVVVDQDTITLKRPFYTRSLRKSEVRGFEKYPSSKGMPYLVLWPKSSEERRLRFENLFAFDGEWKRWISSLPDLGKENESRFTLK